MNLYIYKGLPESIDWRYHEYNLQNYGYDVGCKYNDEIIVVTGALTGIDRQNKPVEFESVNPIIPSFKRKVGVDCVPCYNTWNYLTPEDFNYLIHIYSIKLAQLDISMMTSLYNTRSAFIFSVADEKEAQRARKFYDDLSEGSPALLEYKTSRWCAENENPLIPIKARENIITPELSDARRCILADFYSEIGVDCIAVDKAERTNLTEMNSNRQQIKITGSIGLEPRKRWCEEMNKMFGTEISVEINGEAERGDSNEVRKTPVEEQSADTSKTES